MTTWNLAVSATLDRAPAERESLSLGRAIAGDKILVVTTHDTRFSVSAMSDADDGLAALQQLRDRYATELAERGFTVIGWEAVECLTLAEVERRSEATSLPPMVPAVELADMCGVSKQRVYELEHERRRAAEQGQPHSFPTPVVPGWWLQSAAERYAATRKRKPGPSAHDS